VSERRPALRRHQRLVEHIGSLRIDVEQSLDTCSQLGIADALTVEVGSQPLSGHPAGRFEQLTHPMLALRVHSALLPAQRAATRARISNQA